MPASDAYDAVAANTGIRRNVVKLAVEGLIKLGAEKMRTDKSKTGTVKLDGLLKLKLPKNDTLKVAMVIKLMTLSDGELHAESQASDDRLQGVWAEPPTDGQNPFRPTTDNCAGFL